MFRYSRLIVFSLVAASLMACHAPPAPAPAAAIESIAPGARMDNLIEGYWSAKFARPFDAPDISAQGLADSLATERRYLAEAAAIPRSALAADTAESHDIFLRDRQLAIEGFTFPSELLPVNPYRSEAERFALAAASGRVDEEAATEAFVRWSAQAISNMREGLRRGYTLPRSTVEQTLPWLAALASDSPANPFFKLSTKAKILAAYQSLHDFMQRDYLPRARTTVGMAALPLGESWYAYVVRREAGAEQSPKSIHDFSVADIERLRGRIQAMLAGTAYAGNLAGLLESQRRDAGSTVGAADDLMMSYEELKVQVAHNLPAVVATVPNADFSIRPVDAYAQAFAPPLSYRQAGPTPNGSAILYVNTADLDARPAVALRARFLGQALPGRHLQSSLQLEHATSKYRRFVDNPAFVAGWDIYALSLGEELGAYRDMGDRLGALLVEMECAVTLAVDTGLNAANWSRQQALDYVHAQSPVEDSRAAQLVDRAIAVPGDGLGCWSAAKFRAVRTQAEKFLGARFNLAAFDLALIDDGAIPLDLMETRMKRWQESQAATASDVVR